MRTKILSRPASLSPSIIILLTLFVAGVFNYGRDAGSLTPAALAETAGSAADGRGVAPEADRALTDRPPTESHIAARPTSQAMCPTGTVPVVEGGITLCEVQRTMELPSNFILDCGGLTLVPTKRMSGQRRGTGINWSNDPFVGDRSAPEVAIFLNGVVNVTIRNCTIQDFDFGILAINGKASLGRSGFGQHHIIDNIINARFIPISLAGVDGTEIKGNTLTYTARGGRGLYVGRNSDGNIIQTNTIAANFSNNPAVDNQAVRMPGPDTPIPTSIPTPCALDPTPSPTPTPTPAPVPTLSSNPILTSGSAVLITLIEGPEATLLNAVVNGTLYQLPILSATPDYTEGNRFEGNTIDFPDNVTTVPQNTKDGIVLAVAKGTTVSNNTVNRATAAIRAGIQIGDRQFPGTCSLDPSRYCLQNFDCNITPFDQTSKGTCTLPQRKSVTWLSDNNTIASNTINGPFSIGIAVAGSTTTVRSNTIDGKGGGTGITLLGKLPLESATKATLNRNIVSDVNIGLRLTKIFKQPCAPDLVPSAFGAQISLNDFTVRALSVQTSDDYDLRSELSVSGQGGNYWGGSCPGHYQFFPTVKTAGGVIITEVRDGAPYESPVARVSKLALATPCPSVYPPRPAERERRRPTRRTPRVRRSTNRPGTRPYR